MGFPNYQLLVIRAVETNDIPLRLYRKRYPAGALVELVDRWM
jgi:hypothetical protein